jgi:hypothetical protein
MAYQKNWCWTLHDPTELEVGKLISDHDGISYIVWQEETCPDTGRIHLQGYVQFQEKARLAKAKKILLGDKNHRVHLEGAKGTPSENKTYCTKLGGRNLNECIELQLIRAAPGNPNPAAGSGLGPPARTPRCAEYGPFFLVLKDRVRVGLIQCINKIVRHLADL